MGRSQAAIIYGCFVAAIGVATALTTRGPLRAGLLVLVVLVIGYCLAFLLKPLRPRELTVLRVRQHPERYTATTPLMTFPALQRDDHTTGSTAEVFGVVTLGPDGVTFEPSRRASRRRGVQTLHWGPTWTMQARPLRGPGGLVQLSVVAPSNDESSTLWIRGGKDFVFS